MSNKNPLSLSMAKLDDLIYDLDLSVNSLSTVAADFSSDTDSESPYQSVIYLISKEQCRLLRKLNKLNKKISTIL